jgi:pimeloyl-ACP methyl ester carboxylesterase
MSAVLTRGVLGTTLRTLLQSTTSANQLPMLIHRAATGDPGPLATTAAKVRQSLTQGIYFGMQFSIFSSEFVSRIDPQVVAREAKGTFLGDYWTHQTVEVGRVWPRGEVEPGYDDPVSSKVPALIISGFLDPATPPQNGDVVAKRLPNSLHIVIRNASHSYSGLAPCVDNLMAEFISKASVKGLDTSCTKAIRRPPFVITP